MEDKYTYNTIRVPGIRRRIDIGGFSPGFDKKSFAFLGSLSPARFSGKAAGGAAEKAGLHAQPRSLPVLNFPQDLLKEVYDTA